ncbi:QsdR family transcriptional regulator [Streptomyces sp. NPDC059373]
MRDLAQQRFLAGVPLDMRDLATELGVSRATVYRWAGNKELLLGEVLWAYAEQAIERARLQARGEGIGYLMEVIQGFVQAVDGSVPLRRLLVTDPEPSLRVLTSQHSVVQPRIVEALRTIFQEAVDQGTFHPPIDVDTLSYATVRIAESFLYSDIITGTERHVRRAIEIIRLILREA